MKQLDNKTWIIILIVTLALALLVGGWGMMGYGGYGFNGMCSHMGGVWCYWPSFGWVIQVLITVALVLFIVWIVRQIQNSGGKK
jgi:carbon starvation protein CstA